MCDQNVKCGSCREMFTSETNATLCSLCSEEVSNMILSSVYVSDYKMSIVTVNTFQINILWPSKDYGSMYLKLLKRKKDSNGNNGDVGVTLV